MNIRDTIDATREIVAIVLFAAVVVAASVIAATVYAVPIQ